MRKKSLRLRVGNSDALKFFTNSKMNLGPRMGSNYPPKERPGKYPNNHLFNSLRPKKSTSFQACIMPMNIPQEDHLR